MRSGYNILIAGAGFAGAILGRHLLKYTNANVMIFDKGTSLEDTNAGTEP